MVASWCERDSNDKLAYELWWSIPYGGWQIAKNRHPNADWHHSLPPNWEIITVSEAERWEVSKIV